MATHYTLRTIEESEESENLMRIRNLPRKKERLGDRWNPHHKPKGIPPEIAIQLAEQADHQDKFNFSYHASRHERAWIVDSLGSFYENKWLDDVLRLIKGGKEAHVYQCQANPSVADLDESYLAAKVYRPRQFRSLKNDSLYKEGRQLLDQDGRLITDHGVLHAVHLQTTYGLDVIHSSWIEHEFQAMTLLLAAGCDVPRAYERGNNAILMTYIGGDELAAPTLNSVDLDYREAYRLFKRVLRNIEIMLANKRVHADLSAYNILYWEGKITIIDFPQVIDPNNNRNAFRIFERDVRRVCEYFARQGVNSNPRKIAADLWVKNGFRVKPEVDPGLLDDQDEGDRKYWEKMKS
jgi:RIO kinase 1